MIPLMEIASMDSQISVNQLTPVREFNEAAKELGENLKGPAEFCCKYLIFSYITSP